MTKTEKVDLVKPSNDLVKPPRKRRAKRKSKSLRTLWQNRLRRILDSKRYLTIEEETAIIEEVNAIVGEQVDEIREMDDRLKKVQAIYKLNHELEPFASYLMRDRLFEMAGLRPEKKSSEQHLIASR